MERFKRRFSIDAPIPYSSARRQSEPVIFSQTPFSSDKVELNNNRRYSTTLTSPGTKLLQSDRSSNYYKYSTNNEVGPHQMFAQCLQIYS